MSIAPAKPSRRRAALALVFAAGLACSGVTRSGWRPAAGWFLGAAAVALLLLFGSWGGVHVTELLRRRIALSWRRRRAPAKREEDSEERVAALVRVDAPADAGASDWLPLPLVTSYLDRYGVRCAAVRTAFRRSESGQEAWITLVVDARDNLAALRARSARIETRELAEAARRRLAAQLREAGLSAEHAAVAPSLVNGGVEDWNGVVEDAERVGAYSVSTAGDLGERLASIAAYPAQESWTVLEFTRARLAAHAVPALTVACALRKKGAVELLPEGLRPHRGAHLPMLAALDPGSTRLL